MNLSNRDEKGQRIHRGGFVRFLPKYICQNHFELFVKLVDSYAEEIKSDSDSVIESFVQINFAVFLVAPIEGDGDFPLDTYIKKVEESLDIDLLEFYKLHVGD